MKKYYLKPFIEWFSKLNLRKKKLIINQLEEMFTIEAEPTLQMKVIGLESVNNSLLEKNTSLLKDIKKLESKNKKLENIINQYESGKTLSLINFNHVWAKMNQEEKDVAKKHVIYDYQYNQLKKRYEDLQHQHKVLQKSHDQLIERHVHDNN